jgi:chromosome segregation ATPase
MSDIPQSVPWVVALVSALTAIAQTVNSWRKSRVDVDRIRQELTLELIEKMEAMNAERERRNGAYAKRLAQEKEAILSVNRELQKELGRLRERVRILETRDRAREAEVQALRRERGDLLERVRFLEDEAQEWKARCE